LFFYYQHQLIQDIFIDFFYKRDNVEIRFLEKPNKGFRFGADDGSKDDPNSIGYIKPLMICIMDNTKKND